MPYDKQKPQNTAKQINQKRAISTKAESGKSDRKDMLTKAYEKWEKKEEDPTLDK